MSRGTLLFLKFQDCSVTIRWFRVIIRTFFGWGVEDILLLCREAVFHCLGRLCLLLPRVFANGFDHYLNLKSIQEKKKNENLNIIKKLKFLFGFLIWCGESSCRSVFQLHSSCCVYFWTNAHGKDWTPSYRLNSPTIFPVVWGRRIHQLPLCRGARSPSQRVSWYDTKQSDGEVPVMLELWGLRSSQVHSGPEWYHLIGLYLCVKQN